VCCQVEVSGTS